MKTKTSFMAIVVLIFGILATIPLIVNAQIEVSVKGVDDVQVNYDGGHIVVKRSQPQTIAKPCEKEITFNVIYLEGDHFVKTDVKKPAGDCKVVLEKIPNGLVNSYQSEAKNTRINSPGNTSSGTSPASVSPVTEVSLRLLNSTDCYTFTVLGAPFKDVALCPFDTSKMVAKVKTGALSFAIMFSDTADNKQLRQVVVTRIITQDMKILDIKKSDFGIVTKDKIKLKAYNRTKTKIVFTNGIYSGIALSPDKVCKRTTSTYGFVIFV
ncbi:MAG: hypothetical protein NTX66_02360, partial [Candidatus Falkowbacteria bacterium]|nr:hypothetical protein [Candidatus Falkowbacteria bacterium]